MIFAKIRLLVNVLVVDLKKKYSTKKLEGELNAKGLNVEFDQNFLIRNTSFGGDNKLAGNGKIIDSNLGRFSYVAFDSILSYADIGNFCSIGPRCIIGSGNHPVDRLSTHPVFYQYEAVWNRYNLASKETFEPRKRISIGHDVWIGANCFIKDGVKIGNGSIVAAGSVIVNDVPPYQIYGGVPAKLIKERFKGGLDSELENGSWFTKDFDLLVKKSSLFKKGIKDADEYKKILKELE